VASVTATSVTIQFSFAVFAFRFIVWISSVAVFFLVPVSQTALAKISPDSPGANRRDGDRGCVSSLEERALGSYGRQR
jgi:hypothetical protein